MSGDRRHYSPQFKLQAVLGLHKGQKSAAQIAREHNIGQDLLSRWRDLFQERGAQIFRLAERRERECQERDAREPQQQKK